MHHPEQFQTTSSITSNRISTMAQPLRFPKPQIINITEKTQKSSPSSSNTEQPQRDVVGIFSRSSSDDYSWLVELLKSNYFRETVQEVRPCYIFNNGFQQFVNDLSQCTIGILYHTKNRGRINITDVHDSLYDEELENLNKILGIDNVLVVIDDVEDSSDQEKSRILENQPSIGEWASDLLLISQTDKADKSKLERKLKSIKRFCNPSGNQSLQVERSKVKNTICVFSISEEGRIEWLRRLLSSDIFGNQHVTFHSFSLDDNEGLRAVEFQCKVAVLYHTMQSGEFPITPRGEFLYHKVLPQMSEKLGKGNVVMIIDDVQGKEMMSLKKKRSDIEKLTEDLCPISHKDKEDEIKLVQKLKTLQPFRHMSEHPHKVDLTPQTEKTLNTSSQKTPTSRRSIIGIFSVSEEDHIDWLRRLLSLDIFGQREVTYHKIPSHDNVGLEDGKLQCVVAILYHTMKTGPAVTSQREFLYHKATDQLVQKLGKDNVIVLIDDLQNYTDKKWAMWVQSKIERWAGDLLYFLQEEKHNQHLLVQRLKSLNLFRQPPECPPNANPVQPAPGNFNTISAPASSVIGVFSRLEMSKCSWLERLLSSEEFGNHQVKFQQISPGNMKEFQSMVSLCKFGILYHCMDQGYKPLTDQKNSLYDEELLYLSSTLGKSRVIVVMDEVGNSDKEAKSWTLENLPSLGMLARDVLLFTKQEKTYQEKPNTSGPVDRNLGTLYENLNTLKEILKEGMTSASFSS